MKHTKLVRFFTSLKVTLWLLVLYLFLVFFGTMAQIDKGIFYVKKEYFQTLFVTKPFFNTMFPVFPGGYLIGGLLLLNLLAVLLFKLKWKVKNTGLILSHVGLFILVLGSAATGMFATESHMRLFEHTARNYSEDFYATELVLLEDISPQQTLVSAIDQKALKPNQTLSIPGTPLSLKIHAAFDNTQLGFIEHGTLPTNFVTQGIGHRYQITALKPFKQENTRNNPTVILEVFSQNDSLGIWLVALDLPTVQHFSVGDRQFGLLMRPKRYYYPFSLYLQDFKHDVYPGTTIPKNFSSLVTLTDFRNGLQEDSKIYMNHPLRYEHKTFYQASFGEGDTLSILQVVDNPYWQIPYYACLMISFGLILHFMIRMLSRRTSHD